MHILALLIMHVGSTQQHLDRRVGRPFVSRDLADPKVLSMMTLQLLDFEITKIYALANGRKMVGKRVLLSHGLGSMNMWTSERKECSKCGS